MADDEGQRMTFEPPNKRNRSTGGRTHKGKITGPQQRPEPPKRKPTALDIAKRAQARGRKR